MSYKGFKRLLGESSLERKSRFLLGALTLLLISGSFWLFERMTVSLAYDATTSSGRILASQVVYNLHVFDPQARAALEDAQHRTEQSWEGALKGYQYRLYKPHSKEPTYKPDADERAYIDRFLDDPEYPEERRVDPKAEKFYYYSPVRMTAACLRCHPVTKEQAELPPGALKEGQLYAVVRIQLDSRAIEEGVHLNRAILISLALVTSLLIMAGAYMIVRYVVVKPVKHLKEVSDAIANGYLNVRSEIQTGDEFEDLSFAFNRMLRNLLSMQDELRETNTTLDKKVDELARANLALFESNKLKGDFLATMSHELRTPLHSILGFSDLLEQGDDLTEKKKRWAKNIRSSGAHLLALINDILELAKLEAGKVEVKPEPFVVAELVERVAGDLRPLAEKKSIDLRTDVDDHLPLVEQDSGKLQQVLSNLLSNAVKFTPDGGRVVVRAAAEAGDLVLSVSDTGVGIPASDREAIFDKFRQGANPLTREHEGTGLGLSIVRELANLLGGDVSLHSELGKGSTFTVRVPLRLAVKKSAAEPVELAEPALSR